MEQNSKCLYLKYSLMEQGLEIFSEDHWAELRLREITVQ